MVLITRRTWDESGWPGLTVIEPEQAQKPKRDFVAQRTVFDIIVLAEAEFDGSVDQAARFCDVLSRGFGGVPECQEERRTLYDRARRNFATFTGKLPTGGYLSVRRSVQKKLSRKGLSISDYPDDHYPDLKKELEKPFFIIPGAAQVNPANVCMFNE